MISTAEFDVTGKHRYILTRIEDETKPVAVFIMLNSSTANAVDNDPTIRRCIAFARSWGYGGIRVVNLFSLVSPDPKALITEKSRDDRKNDKYILEAIRDAGIIIAAWGAFKEARARAAEVLYMLEGYIIHCLGQNADGSPKHPLYLRADTKPVPMKVRE